MRVCLICTEKLPVPPVKGGAIQTYIHGILPWLCREHEVTVVCRADPLLPNREQDGPARYERVVGGEPMRYFGNVCRFLQAEAPFDAVAVFNRPAHLLDVVRAAGGARMLLSMHNDMFNYDRIPRLEAREVLTQTAKVITISDYVRTVIDQLHPGFAHKLRAILSGVDTAAFRPIWEEAVQQRRRQLYDGLGLRGGQVVLHVSRLSPRKGNYLVLQAMEEVRQTHPAAELLMVGSPRYGSSEPDAYASALHRRARRLGDAVRFTGFVPPKSIADLFLAGDLFICASQWQEPLARVHYEAMATGLPIITTDRGGNAEVIEEGGNGLIVSPHDDPLAFTAAIRRLLDDAALREQMGRRGRALAEERYTWQRVASEWLEVLSGR